MALHTDYIHIVSNSDKTKDVYFFDDKLKGKQKNNWQIYFNKDFLKSKNIATFKVENEKLFAKFHTIVKIEEWQEIGDAITKESIKEHHYMKIENEKTKEGKDLLSQKIADERNAYDVIMYAYWKFKEQYPEFVRITKQE